ncbi:hypothetical protein MMYC01_204122 [Madurella mycetomatis]|uniref:Uncharacterized protein n=1 Tax=Madurella mycetomatis TaxID=100816 RepID=A0A175W993_9PEZI|nr:hypothetical protein MMYC01_204122 [Madurella mycetomatis]
MATEAPPHSDDAARGRRSSVLRASRSQQHDLRAVRSGRARATRRRPSAVGCMAHNVESFNRNRAHRVRRTGNAAPESIPRRVRTRSIAREEDEQERLRTEQQPEQQMCQDTTVTPPPAEPPMNVKLGGWKPSIVIGSPLWLEREDPSPLEIADRKIAQARLWVEQYQGVPQFTRMLQEAIQERGHLDETDRANTLPRSALRSLHSNAVRQRLDLLNFLLQSCEFAPERANLEAAISGYESGTIPYSDSYTLIWAGHIVDRCPSFDSFTADRSERLDRYLTQYGPGWLWYEPPLSAGGGTTRGPTVLAKKGLCLENLANWRLKTENMGHYRVTMGFCRRKELVCRDPTFYQPPPPTVTAAQATRYLPPRKARTSSIIPTPGSTSLRTVPDPDGPRIFWSTLLDSGATLPCIFEADLPFLQINPSSYAAQSGRVIATAESVSRMRVYELDVGIFHDPTHPLQAEASSTSTSSNTNSNSSNSHNHRSLQLQAVVPAHAIPVVALPGRANSDGDAELAPDRLSGLLPFHVCYVSSAPGNFRIWMGEDRRDVLGAARLPGQMRYAHPPARPAGGEEDHHHYHPGGQVSRHPAPWLEHSLRTPERVVFEHDVVDADTGMGRVLRDEDDCRHGGSVLVSRPSGTNFDGLDPMVEGVRIELTTPRWRSEMKRSVRRGSR